MKKLLLAIGGLLAACHGPRITPVAKLGAVKPNDRGVYYFLPRADVLVQVEVTRTTETPGEYQEFACLVQHLVSQEQLDKRHKAKKTEFALGDVVVKPIAGIDPKHIYHLKLPRSPLVKNSIALEYLPTGELKGGTLACEDLTAKVITQVASSFVTVASAALGARYESGTGAIEKQIAERCKDSNPPVHAHMAASQLEKLMGDRVKLLSVQSYGEPLDNTKWKLEKLDRDIELLLGKFVGLTEKKTIVLPFLVDPDGWGAATEVELFQLDKNAGVKRVMESDRVVWDSRFDAPTQAANLRPIKLKWMVDPKSASVFSATASTQGEVASRSMLVYRIPRNGQVAILNGDKTKAIKDIIIPQLGGLGYLPKLKSAEFALYEGTGGLAKLIAVSKTIDPDQVKAAGDALASSDTLFLKPNPMDLLIRDLERQVKVKELQDKLNGAAVEDESED